MIRRFLVLGVAGLLGPVSCDPEPTTAPIRDDPAAYAFSDPVVYEMCNGWSEGEPTVEQGLFDIWFRGAGTRPSPEHIDRVLNAGGRIVHEFNLPGLRAIVSPTRVPEIAPNFAKGVTAPNSLRVLVDVEYRRPVSRADLDRFTSFGGENPRRSGIGLETHIRGSLPDSTLPVVRGREEVRRVSGFYNGGFFCLGS